MRWTRIGGMTALAVALAIGLALSLGLWSHWTASAQDTFIVNQDTGAGDPAPCGSPDFPSVSDIETVIDDTDVADGDTLVLCPGMYNAGAGGAVQVDKELIIEGLAAADRSNIAIQGTAGNDGFVISVDGVTIRHLKLLGAGTDRGVVIEDNADNNTIQDMEITAWDVGVDTGDAHGNVVETSKIHTNADTGIYDNSGENTVIRNNEITDNTNYGIDIVGEDQMLVDSNSLSGNGGEQIQISGRTTATIVRNQIEMASDGIFIGNVPTEALIIIGGSADMANTFTGPFGAPKYYVGLHCSAQNTVDATYNWWGATARPDIANRVFNDEDDTGVECPPPDDVNGAVVFHPWATSPAPTPTPSPTPSATATATATGTPTPTATPGATRTIDLSPQGWHDIAWSGPNATEPGTALACIAGKYSIAYAYNPTATPSPWLRYVPGQPELSNMSPLNTYDTLLVNITVAGATCEMLVAR